MKTGKKKKQNIKTIVWAKSKGSWINEEDSLYCYYRRFNAIILILCQKDSAYRYYQGNYGYYNIVNLLHLSNFL
nr:hypothetical protein [Butyrivibrio sp.]